MTLYTDEKAGQRTLSLVQFLVDGGLLAAEVRVVYMFENCRSEMRCVYESHIAEPRKDRSQGWYGDV